jgi:starch synthase
LSGLRVLFVSAELAPLAQSGGLGDAVAGLARALVERGHDVACALPAYRAALESPACPPLETASAAAVAFPHAEHRGRWLAGTLADGVGVRLLDLPELYDRDALYGGSEGPYPDDSLRFCAFARAAAAFAAEEPPDVVVAHDWHASLVPCLLREVHHAGAGTVQAVHNAAYQGRYDAATMALTGLPGELFRMEGLEFHGGLCLLKAGLLWADRIVAVSPTYAREIRTPAFGEGLEGVFEHRADVLVGIANGLDAGRFDPRTDAALPARFHAGRSTGRKTCRSALLTELDLDPPDPGRLCAAVGRFAHQKGWDVLADAIETLVARGASVALLGSGDADIAARLRALAGRHPRRVSLRLGWDDGLARRLYAGADCVLVPSRFEPCGLVQLLAQRYGALPVAHAVGGLVDTIEDGRTGILFAPLTPEALADAVDRAAELYGRRGPAAVRAELLNLDVSWHRPAERWEAVLEEIVRARRGSA